MLKYCILFFVLLCRSVSAAEYHLIPNITFVEVSGLSHEEIKQSWTGTCSNIRFHWFEVYARTDSDWALFGVIQKLPETTRAYQFHQNNELLSTHRATYGFGSFFDAAKTFEVLGSDSKPIGTIEGNYFTNQAATFLFYDENHQLFAIADLDNNWSTLTVESLDGTPIFTCKKLFHYYYKRHDLFSYISKQAPPTPTPNQYEWHIVQNDDQTFDPRFFWPFISFISEVWWAGQTL